MPNPIPILDLSDEIAQLWPQISVAVERVLKSGQFILGPEVAAFESEVAQYLGVKHAVGCNSGTDALVISLRALGIKPGDEIITTPFSFVATAGAISIIGAKPVFVDIEPDTFNIDPNAIEAKITDKTRAIIPVHLFGQAADMDSINAVAATHNLKVLEDVAQAFGGKYKGAKVGTLGDIAAWSFFPTKNLGAYGDGGLITTDDDQLADLARMLRVHGSKKRYHNELDGYNSRLDALQAAILRVKLPYIDQWNGWRRAAADRYDALLRDAPGIVTPVRSPDVEHVFHQYTVRVKPTLSEGGSAARDAMVARLNAAGIGAMVYYPIPINRLPVYAKTHGSGAYPHCDQACDEVMSLPMWPGISAEKQQAVADAIRAT